MNQRNIWLGIGFILLGVLLLLQSIGWGIGGLFFLLLALLFGFWYTRNQTTGLFIATIVFASIGLSQLLEKSFHLQTDFFLFFLGIGFLLLYFIHMRRNLGSQANWPLFLGILLIALNLLEWADNWFRMEYDDGNLFLSILLVLVGIWLLFGNRKK